MATRKKAVTKKAPVQKAEADVQKPEDDEPKTMSKTLAAARASGRYELSIAYSGRKSLSNQDEVAVILENRSPDDVLHAAERLLGLPTGELKAKYDKLNPGQKRMNGGNRIRGAIKRGDATIADLKKAISA